MAHKPIRIVFTRRASAEVAEAEAWWRENRSAAPGAIAEDLGLALQLLAAQPSIGARAVNTRLRGVRRVLLDRVGYHVYYRVETRRRIVTILAFWHSHRGTGPGV